MDQFVAGTDSLISRLKHQADQLVRVSDVGGAQLLLAIEDLVRSDLAERKMLARTVRRRPRFLAWSRNRRLLARSPLFDIGYYLSRHPEVASAGADPIDHYLARGLNGGIDPHPLFSTDWYLANNPDVKASGLNPLVHFLRFGGKERRSPHPLFDMEFYVQLYPDVGRHGINPLVHYTAHGGDEGRRPHCLFDAATYLELHSYLRGSGMTPLEHYCRFGFLTTFQPHPVFDPLFYLSSNRDVLLHRLNPLVHYLVTGAREGRDPSASFSTNAYLEQHPEVAQSGINPLVHFASGADNAYAASGRPESIMPAFVAPDLAAAEAGHPPTQQLQDYLYDEFGVEDRMRILNGLKMFRLPFVPGHKASPLPNEEREWLVDRIYELAVGRPATAVPEVSIVIPVFNQLRFTLGCLYSILASRSKHTYELLVADDCSTDATADVFSRDLPSIRYIRTEKNLGFLRNCNYAAAQAKGKVLVLLNNDTFVLPGWLDELIDTFALDPNIGLVGSMLVFADGRLQEAGGLVFADGSGWNYGRFDDPRHPRYSYLRDTDYVSGASIAVRAETWRALGGFDERYEMAYYEDTDLAFRMREAGKRVVVQPLSQLIHFEGVSSGTDLTQGVKRYQVINGETFRERWGSTIASYGMADPENLPIHRGAEGRILVIDACTPTPDRDSGSMDTYQYLRILISFGMRVTFIAENLAHVGRYTRDLQRIGVEVLYAPYVQSLDQVLESIGPQLDYILVYRAPVAASLYDRLRQYAPQAKLIFDTVDLHFLREEREAEITKDKTKAMAAAQTREMELDLIRNADATIVLSAHEREVLARLMPDAPVFEIPIVREIPGRGPLGFGDRRDIVFIGGFRHAPNVDGVKWFVKDIWPKVRDRGIDGQFVIVGSDIPHEIYELTGNGVLVKGFVQDLGDVFDACRVSVAPLRYGAGLKGKVISSLSYGVPVVATSVAVEGGGFVDGDNVIIADRPADFADAIVRVYSDIILWEKLAVGGILHCGRNFSVGAVSLKLRALLEKFKQG
jgi:GT2 family glycosyltransferase/glycosyltransferase involved in cell wall biosynthesis